MKAGIPIPIPSLAFLDNVALALLVASVGGGVVADGSGVIIIGVGVCSGIGADGVGVLGVLVGSIVGTGVLTALSWQFVPASDTWISVWTLMFLITK